MNDRNSNSKLDSLFQMGPFAEVEFSNNQRVNPSERRGIS